MAHRVSERRSGARPLVGRDDELAQLAALVEQVRAGLGCLAVVEGEAGIGKTRLVEEAIALVDGRRWYVARGNAEELARERPFGLVADALGLSRRSPDRERARIAELLVGSPEAAPATPLVDLRFHIVESVCDLVEHEAARRPLLLVTEDLHWADASSLLTLHRLCARLRPLPVLLLATTRPGLRRPELAQLLEAFERAGSVLLRLPPLAEEAVVRLAEACLGAPVGPRLRAELGRAAGNPLFALELVEALKGEQAIELREGVAELEQALEPAPSLRLTILRRVSFLPGETLELLRLASVLGASFSFDDLAAVTGRRASELVAPLREAVDAGIVAAAGEQLAFRHDLVRDAFYLDIPPAARRAVHAQTGRALAAAGAPAQRVAVHLSLGASPGDQEAVDWLRRAAAEVGSKDPGAAVELLERALALVVPEGTAGDEVRADLIMPLVWSGRTGEAEAAAADVLGRTPDVGVAAQVYHGLASALYLHQRMPALAEMCDDALALADLPPVERAFFLGVSTIPLLALGRIEETLARADKAIAERSGSATAMLFAMWARGQVELLRGRYADAVETLAELPIPAPEAEESRVGSLSLASLRRALARLVNGWALIAADRPADAAVALAEARLLFERTGALPYISMCHRSLASARFVLGEWDDALAESRSAWLLAEETGVHGLRAHQGDPAPLIHAHRGDVGRAKEELAKIESALGPEPPLLATLWLLPTKALVADADGDPEAALRRLEETCELGARLDLVPDYRMFARRLVLLALESGRRELVERAVDATAELGRRAGGVATAEGVALLSRGLADDDLDALAAAVAAYRRGASVLDLALACEEAGAALARRDRRAEALPLLDEALELCERVGAAREAARVKQHLRALGVRHGARVGRTRDRSGWQSVTPSELKVVELLALGLSNREIAERLYISRRTVRSHLENVFRKLDVSSRAELAALTARRGASPPAAPAR